MLFEPFEFRGLKIANRIVRSATYEKKADLDGFVTDSLTKMYEDLASGGAGLLITGNALVHVSGRTVPQMICIHNDFYIDGLRRLCDAVHRLDGRIAIQLVHGGRQCFPVLLGGERPIAPSEVDEPFLRVTPREMTHDEVWRIIEAFGQAARRAVAAGFDAIQIHGAHGYLVNQFLSPHTNRRDDYWGGDEERRFHFLEEIYKAVREETGYRLAVMIKLNSHDYVKDGLTPLTSVKIARRLESLGFDAVEVSGGMYESGGKTIQRNIVKEEQEAYFSQASLLFKSEIRIPVMLVGGIRSRAVAESLLRNKVADLVCLSRPLIREPDLPRKFLEGKDSADCISCNGCIRFFKIDTVRCTHLDKLIKSPKD